MSMHPRPLPPEVVRLILDAHSGPLLKDIVRASHVARSWRSAARAHPVYSQLLALYASDLTRRGRLLFFCDRLAAGAPDGKVHLDLYLELDDEDEEAMKDVREVLMPALAQALPRLVTLSVKCAEELVPDLLDALCEAQAPRLKVFKLFGPESAERTMEVEELPVDLFKGHAPLLVDLQMDACQFPEEGAVEAFSEVRELLRMVDEGYDEDGIEELHPERWFVSCPALDELFINGNTFNLERASWASCPPPEETQLDRLTVVTVDGAPSTELIVRAFAHPAMSAITVETSDVNAATIDLMLGHLDDSAVLHLDISGDEDTLEYSVLDAARARERTFRHSPMDLDELDLEAAETLMPAFARVAPRFTRVSVTHDLYAWNNFLALFPDAEQRLVAVDTLELYVAEGIENYLPDRQLALPALAEIRLTASQKARARTGCVRVETARFLQFVRLALHVPAGRKMKLVFCNARPRHTGDKTNRLSGTFEISR